MTALEIVAIVVLCVIGLTIAFFYVQAMTVFNRILSKIDKKESAPINDADDKK